MRYSGYKVSIYLLFSLYNKLPLLIICLYLLGSECNATEKKFKINIGDGILLAETPSIYEEKTILHVLKVSVVFILKSGLNLELTKRFISSKNGFMKYMYLQEASNVHPFTVNIGKEVWMGVDYLKPYYGFGTGVYYLDREYTVVSNYASESKERDFQLSIGGMAKIGVNFYHKKEISLYTEIQYDYFYFNESRNGNNDNGNGGGTSLSIGVIFRDNSIDKLISVLWGWTERNDR